RNLDRAAGHRQPGRIDHRRLGDAGLTYASLRASLRIRNDTGVLPMLGRSTATALALMLALAACGSKEKKAESGDATYKVSEKDGKSTLTVETDEGKAQIVSGEGEAALPTGLPLYPGATVTSSTRITSDGANKGGTMLSFDTPDATGQIVAFYKAAAQKAGYKIEAEMKMGEMEMLSGKNPGKGGFTLTANREQGKTTASLISGAGGG
ncbi:MAG: hypothetical protein ACREEO_06105, partial [Phenylobacterium sp.]